MNKISKKTRQNIIDRLNIENITWSGRLDEVDFLSRFYNLGELPSHDYRYEDAAGDIYQHRINNYDWEDDWVFGDSRFGLYESDEKFLSFLCEMIHPVVRSDEDAKHILKIFNEELKEDSFEITERSKISGRPLYAPRQLSSIDISQITDVKKIATEFNADYLKQQLIRMESSIETDPPLAIGTAKELIETCCKTILSSKGKEIPKKPKLPNLVKETLKELNLTPENISGSSETEKILKILLSNLSSIAQSITELRNIHGTGHGKNGNTKGLESKHAKLAVGAASTLAIFLLETFVEEKKT